MKQIRILIGLFILGLLLAACGGDVGSALTYKVMGDADQVVISYTTETGGKEETAVTPPWETSITIGGSFSGDSSSSSSSFISNSGDFETETAVLPAETPAATQADRPDAGPTPTPFPPSSPSPFPTSPSKYAPIT